MSRDKGVALFISVSLMFLLSIGAIVVLLTAYNYANISENQIKRLRAITLAEAGINYAYWKLRTDETDFALEAEPPDGKDIVVDSSGLVVKIIVTGGPLPAKYTIQSKVTYIEN